jgi:hypothetical protein
VVASVAQINQNSPQKVDPTREYVVGSGPWSSRINNVLSNFTDDVEWLVGCDVYERMARDPVVSKNLLFQKLSVTSEGVQLHTAVSEKDPQFEKAQEIRDFEERNLAGLHRPITQIIDEMMAALKRGHTVAEITYNEPSSLGADPYKLLLQSIKVKPRNTTAFVVDPFRNVLGLTAWTYGSVGLVSTQNMISGEKVIPPEKFAVLTLETEDEDPRGLISLRPAYNFWAAKCLVPPMHLQWLEKSAVPSTVGTTGPNAQMEQEFDAEGNPTGRTVTPQEAAAEKLAQLKSGATAVFPDGFKVNVIEVSGNGQQFTRCLQDFDTQIDYALSLQSGATKDSRTGSYSSKRIFKDVLDVLVWSRKHRVAQVIYNDILKRDVEYNFGKEFVHLTPLVMIGDEEGKDWAMDAEAATKLAPNLTDSQWLKLCAELGIAPPEEGETLPNRTHPAAFGTNPQTSQEDPNATV